MKSSITIAGRTCFVKGTPVSTQNGSRATETLIANPRSSVSNHRPQRTGASNASRIRYKAKRLVWSRDEASGKVQLKRVAQTFERYAATLALTFSNGETVGTILEHPFYAKEIRWRMRQNLHDRKEVRRQTVYQRFKGVRLASLSRRDAVRARRLH